MNCQSPVEAIFFAALEKQTPAERLAYLDVVCGEDEDLRFRVQRLLNAQPQLGSFLQRPAAKLITSAEDASPAERPGTVIGPYMLLEQIGEGGFGMVFMAEQQQPVRRQVALKVIKPGMDSKQVVARFEAERQALALMDHPHIAHVLDGGTTDAGRPYFVMELIRGIPITQFCDDKHLTPRERLKLFRAVCQAVQHAHQKGIIHRDLKPSNVLVMLLDGKPVAKVIDFGIAKALGRERLTDKTLITGFAPMLGTPLYMSPEQAAMSGPDVDTRTDIYALGVLLYELLTGTTPFDKARLKEASYEEIRRIIREEEPAKLSTRISTLGQAAISVSANRQSEPKRLSRLFRGELDWIVMKALEKDRNRRYETASNLAADVQRYLDDEPVQACPPTLPQRVGKWGRRHKAAMRAAAAGFLLAVAGLIASTWLIWQEKEQTKTALAQARSSTARTYKVLDQLYGPIIHKLLSREKELTAEDRQIIEIALSSYEESAKQDNSDPEMRLLSARAYHRVGEIREERGRYEQAAAAYQQALAISAKLVAEFPHHPDYRQILARSYTLAGGQWGQLVPPERLPELVENYALAIRLQEPLVHEEPTNLEYQHDLGISYARLGYLRLIRLPYLAPAEAREPLRRALAIRKDLVAAKPGDFLYRQELGMSLGNLGHFLMATGQYEQAEEIVRQELEVRQKLVDDFPAEPEVGSSLAEAYMDLAALRKRTGKDQESIAAIRNELSIRKKQVAEFPNLFLPQKEVARCYLRLGDALRQIGAHDEAVAAYQEATALCREVTRHRTDHIFFYVCWGRALAGAGADASAMAEWVQAVRAAENAQVVNEAAWLLAITFEPGFQNPKKAVELAEQAVSMSPQNGSFWNTLGVASYRAGQWQDAVDALTKSVQLRPGGNVWDWLFLAMAHQRLGHAEEAGPWYDRAVQWVDKNKPADEDLRRFRAEAAAVLGIVPTPGRS
jgi:serine/threonine protein kinase